MASHGIPVLRQVSLIVRPLSAVAKTGSVSSRALSTSQPVSEAVNHASLGLASGLTRTDVMKLIPDASKDPWYRQLDDPRMLQIITNPKTGKLFYDPHDELVKVIVLMDALKSQPPIVAQLYFMNYISSMSLGALSGPAFVTLSMSANFATMGYNLQPPSQFGTIRPEHVKWMFSGEGSIPIYFPPAWRPPGVQEASGQIYNGPDYFGNAIGIEQKGGQAAKRIGGVVAISKLLKNPDVARQRALVPPDATNGEIAAYLPFFERYVSETAYKSPNPLTDSIDELTRNFRKALSECDNKTVLVLKFPITKMAKDDWIGFAKVLKSAAETFPEVFEKVLSGQVRLMMTLVGQGVGVSGLHKNN